MFFLPRLKRLSKESFLNLNDQEEATGIFSGEIYTFKRHWLNNRGIECTESGCPTCASHPENHPSFRFRVNFVTLKNGQWIAKVFESGGEVYDLLVSLDKKFNLSKVLIDITRRGMKQNTKFDILPRADKPVSQEMMDKMKAVDLLPLTFATAKPKTEVA
jgi:hypothetical protein